MFKVMPIQISHGKYDLSRHRVTVNCRRFYVNFRSSFAIYPPNMPEKVKEQPAESTADQQEEAKDVPEADKDKETHEAGSSNGAQEQDGAEADLAKTDKQAEGDAPKRRGRKPKQSGEGPETKKPKKETKTPERVSSRVRNRSVGEKLPAFKDMEDLPSPTKRKSKGDAKEDEKPATNEGEQVKATA